MAGNILGQNISPEINEQIRIRQLVQGSGQTDGKISRNNSIKNYLNNRNAFIKLASGIGIQGEEGEKKLRELSSIENNYLTEEEIQNVKSYGLAQNVVLFNTTQRWDKESNSYVNRSGARETNNLSSSIDKMYGGLGGNSRGLQPVPGITDISIECLNRGSIKKATVNIKAYNKFQFGLIELLYLRLGYMVMLEWGWDKYIREIKEPNSEVIIENTQGTVIENEWFSSNSISQDTIFTAIKKYENKYLGNYSGFFGKVSNFTWKLNKDNTYDITLNLITIGSIIESLSVNIPAVGLTPTKLNEQKEALRTKFELNEEGEDSNPILNNAGADELNQFIATTILDFPTSNKNYCYLPNLASGNNKTVATNSNRKKIPPESRYYIRFETLLEKIQTISIPDVVNGNSGNNPLLKFDLDSSNSLCAYELNLIPLSPSKVIFSPLLEDNYLTKTTSGIIGNFIKQLKPFAITKTKNVHYGQLLNCYFNLNFISKVLSSNRDKKGRVSIFKFLESLCDAINESTGNTTNLEPAIKDNRIIYILEQNPIKGLDSTLPKSSTTPFIVYGYNQESSTFVKDFGFQTKITPDLAAMISIGAAAEGSSTKNINAIPFNYWNRGLQNRFQEKFIDNPTDVIEKSPEEKKKTPEEKSDQDVKDSFSKQIKDGSASYTSGWSSSAGYYFTYNGFKIKAVGSEYTSKFTSRKVEAEDDNILSAGLAKYKELLAKNKRNQEKLQKENTDSTIKIVGKAANAANNYSSYLTNAFGGATGEYTVGDFIDKKKNIKTQVTTAEGTTKTQFVTVYEKRYTGKPITVQERNAKWWSLDSNDDFTKQGQSAYKLYLNQINQLDYNEQKPILSGEGFIPVSLNLTIDGLGGIKIYNKITVDSRILPVSYPSSLKFIATKINHKINNNVWETSITTISTPPTDNKPSKTAGNATTANYNKVQSQQQPLTEKGPIPPLNPNQKLIIIDNRTVAGSPFDSRTYKKEQSIAWLLGELNINTQKKWETFLNTLDIKYPGYKLIINATYRTYQRSIELKQENSKNASPGYSPHNYAYAIDMNVTDPKGFTFLKKDRKSWVESGIPQIAEALGMRWGGSFENYVDCVHFDVSKVTDASIRNAKKDNKGLPQSQWNTKNTNFV